MFEPIGESRPLPFPLKDQVTNGNTVEPLDFEAAPFIWPDDSTERTLLPLWISLDEWVAINSAVDVGADIAYPEQYIEVIMMLMRQTAYKVPICSLIIDCIANDEDVKQALVDALKSSDEFNTFISQTVQGLTVGQIIEPLIAGSCDNAVIAGKMLALVAAMDINNRDALEVIEAATNDEELIGDFLEAIPIAGELPFGDILLMAQDVLEDFAEEYDSVSTTERKEALARALWCLAIEKEDCALSYGDLYVFFSERIASGLTIDSLIAQLFTWLVSRDFETDDAVFDGMMFLQVASLRLGGRFFGINMPKIGALTRDAEPSSIWEEWEPCIPPEDLCGGGEQVDFRLSEAAWTIWLSRGLYFSGEGYGLNPAVSGNRVSIWRSMAPEVVRMRFNVSHECSEIRLYIYNGGIDSLIGATTSSVLNDDGTRTYTMSSIGGNAYDYLIDIGGASALDADFRLHWVCWNYDEE